MKQSGVSWLGEIPENWDVAPLKTAFTRVKRPTFSNAGIVTAFRDGEVTLRSNRRSAGYTEAEDYSGYQRIMPSDLAIHSMDAFAGAIGVSDSEGICSPVLSVCVAKNGNDPRYMAYQLRLMSKRGWIEALSRSVRERTSEFRWAEAGIQKVALPPVEEQKAIADFLDKELKLIDALIEKQHLLVASLDELLKAQIHKAITRGTSVPDELQSTDVEWAQSIPAGWTIVKASRLLRARKGARAAMLSAEYCGEHEGEFPVYSGQTENNGVMARVDSFEFDLPPRSVLFTTTVGSSRVMTVSMIGGKFSLSQNCMIMQNIAPDVLSTDFAYWLLSVAFEYKKRQLAKHMQLSFRMADLYSYKLPLPPLSEQIKIAKYLTGLEATNVRLKTAASNMVRILQDRRQALIGAAVTGKIDIEGKN